MTLSPQKKALLVTIVFGVAGILGTIFLVSDWIQSLPLVIFYAILTINTYFSIELFSGIVPPTDSFQKNLDALLFLCYLVLAWNLNSPLFFTLTTLILFIVAPTKYTALLYTLPYPKLLKRKILIDLCGTMLSALTLIGIFLGHARASVWIFCAIFALANFIFLVIKPMYRLDKNVS